MKIRGKKNRIMAASLFTIGVTFLVLMRLIKSVPEKEVLRFEEAVGIDLPDETEIIFKEDTHGALGDGESLYIFKIDPSDMNNIKERIRWNSLPINIKLFEFLDNRIIDERISSLMKLGTREGWYLIRNRYNKPLKAQDFSDISYNNVIVCIIDYDENLIYYYTSDM